jgi:hypothetical protein
MNISTSIVPATQPIAEAAYAITSNGRESHLAYSITQPSTSEELQIEFGLRHKGSFICLVKNPSAPGLANATLDNPAGYPEDIQKKFGNLRWMPLEPELLNYQNAQLLLIGDGEGGIGRVLVERSKDVKNDENETPPEEREKQMDEDMKKYDEGMKKLGETLKKWGEEMKQAEEMMQDKDVRSLFPFPFTCS